MTYSPYNTQPVAQPQQIKQQGNPLLVMMFLALFGFGGYWLYNNSDSIVIPNIIEPSDKVVTEFKDTYIVRVYETETSKTPKWMIDQLNDDSFWLKWIPDNGMRYYTINPKTQADEAVTYIAAAEKAKIQPPFWLHAKKGGKVLQIYPFEESKTIKSRFVK